MIFKKRDAQIVFQSMYCAIGIIGIIASILVIIIFLLFFMRFIS